MDLFNLVYNKKKFLLLIEWADETPVAVSSLKIVYQGRFLDDGTTLESKQVLILCFFALYLVFNLINNNNLFH
jgi:hypothetical protein